MKRTDKQPPPAGGPERLWFGTGLWPFLRAELRDFPQRRVAALRLFTVTLTIALVGQSLHLPPLGAIAILVCLSYNPYANTGESLIFGMRQFGYVCLSVLIGILALMLAGNEPWLMLPLAFAILAMALFHARLIAWPTGIALWFSIPVLYSPSTPDASIYNALWNIPIIGILAIGTWTIVHLAIKPQDPLRLLTAGITAQMAAVEQMLDARIADSNGQIRPRAVPEPAAAGGFGKRVGLLEHVELMHPSLRGRRRTHLELLVEIDSLREFALWLDQALTADHRVQPMQAEKLSVYLRLRDACALLRTGIADSRDVSAQAGQLLADAVLHGYSLPTHPSLLAAMWRSLQRIAILTHALHTPAATADRAGAPNAPDEPDAADAIRGRLPAWWGYAFWAEHIDSLQYGIKFALGAILCMLIIEALHWPDINTAIPTCLVAAQTSLGADYRLSILRLSGATLGGILAYCYVLVLQSQLDTIAGFAMATTPVWALTAWISAGSERIAYLGRQLGFSFALFVLHDYGAVTDLYLPRDRVLGILLGVVVMGVLDYALWPRRSLALARLHGAAALRALAGLAMRPTDLQHLLGKILPERLAAEKDLAAAEDLSLHARLEPDAVLAGRSAERQALEAIIANAGKLSGLLQLRGRYRLLSGARFGSFPPALQQHSRDFDTALAAELNACALLLQGEAADTGTVAADVHARLKISYTDHHRINSLPADMAKEWELRFLLDQQIMELTERIRRSAATAAGGGHYRRR